MIYNHYKISVYRMVFILTTAIIFHAYYGLTSYATAKSVMDSKMAIDFMEAVLQKAQPILDNSQQEEAERIKLLSEILDSYIAFDPLARFVVGQYWRNLDALQQNEFLTIFKTYAIKVNAGRLSAFKGAKVTIEDAHKIGRQDQLVHSLWLENDQSTPFKVNWRLRNIEGQIKILDVIIEGISMAQTQRDEFQAVLARAGFNGLIENLDKINKNLSF